MGSSHVQSMVARHQTSMIIGTKQVEIAFSVVAALGIIPRLLGLSLSMLLILVILFGLVGLGLLWYKI